MKLIAIILVLIGSLQAACFPDEQVSAECDRQRELEYLACTKADPDNNCFDILDSVPDEVLDPEILEGFKEE